jgi:hypothetical protein
MRVFGIEMVTIPELQAMLPSKRTRLIDSGFDQTLVPFSTLRDPQSDTISRGLEFPGHPVRVGTPPEYPDRQILGGAVDSMYAKIGLEDALAFPDLLPGSIVRLNPRYSLPASHALPPSSGGAIYAIQHSKGIWCGRLAAGDDGRIRPMSSQLAFAHLEFRVPAEARILGTIDMEIRWMDRFLEPKVPSIFSRSWQPKERIFSDVRFRGGSKLGEFIRSARLTAGLTFREASSLSRRIAEHLQNNRYFAASGSLSDYEARNVPPRHVEKVVSLCILYGIPFSDFLSAMGLAPQEMGRDSLLPEVLRPPEEFVKLREMAYLNGHGYNPYPSTKTQAFDDLPSFVIEALFEGSGILQPSMRDVYPLGPEGEVLLPYSGYLLTLVNRQKKRPIRLSSKPVWQQPVYLLRRRDGRFVCGSCSLDNNVLTVYPDPQACCPPLRLRNRVDAEVVGQVVVIARQLP